MILCIGNTDKLQLSASAAQPLDCHVSGIDTDGASPPVISTYRKNTAVSTTAATDISDVAASGTTRNIKTISVFHRGGTAVTVTIQHTDGTITVGLWSGALSPGQTLSYVEGIGWVVSAPQPGFSAGLVTALPGSPTDGLECVYTDSLTAPTYWWRLRYHAVLGKWLFLGGPDLRSEQTAAFSCTTTATWQTMTAPPSLTIPVAGIYRLEVYTISTTSGGSSGTVTRRFGHAVNAVQPPATDYLTSITTFDNHAYIYKEMERTFAAGDALTIQCLGTTTITQTYNSTRLGLRPVRLG